MKIKEISLLVAGAVAATAAMMVMGAGGAKEKAAQPPAAEVTFYGGGGAISGGVVVPGGRAMLFTSGTVPEVADANAKPGERARYGDTKTQAMSALKKVEDDLKKQGLTMKDVVYLRAYLVPDPMTGNKMDFKGWNQAYAQFFNNKENPVKVARSTIAVAGLYDPDLLFEVEAVAVFPAKK